MGPGGFAGQEERHQEVGAGRGEERVGQMEKAVLACIDYHV